MMTRTLTPTMTSTLARNLALALTLMTGLALPAQAECFADYKAKQDNPLRLHYGVIALTDADCDRQRAAAGIAQRIASDGWTLLNVLAIFDREGLAERKDSAGPYFLRY